MSVFVGHTVTGYATARILGGGILPGGWRTALFAATVANLPDVDLLVRAVLDPGMTLQPRATHSLAAALLAALVGGAVLGASRGRFLPAALLTGSVYASHVLLDSLAPERAGAHAGVALAWPLTDLRLTVGIPMPDWLFGALTLEPDPSVGFLASLLTWRTLRVMAVEAILFAPLLALVLLLTRHRAPA